MKGTSLKHPLPMMMMGTVVLLASLTGCGAMGLSEKNSPDFDNMKFMDLWRTYSSCQAASDLQLLHDASNRLNQAAYSQTTPDQFLLPLPKKIEQWVELPPTRLAVDVRAMALACSLRTGQVAQQTGRNDLAREMFHTVLVSSDTNPAYHYYHAQAKARLAEVEIGLQAFLPHR